VVNQLDFSEAFNEYLDDKILDVIREFEQSESEGQMYKAQGKLQVLRKMKQIRVEVQSRVERT
jgi:predicted HAD superfamily phosphohydrolase|tara:strand:- start:875 stop:1063 length:189 start_codon:yes stop_codon:yes gene_type:complete